MKEQPTFPAREQDAEVEVLVRGPAFPGKA